MSLLITVKAIQGAHTWRAVASWAGVSALMMAANWVRASSWSVIWASRRAVQPQRLPSAVACHSRPSTEANEQIAVW